MRRLLGPTSRSVAIILAVLLLMTSVFTFVLSRPSDDYLLFPDQPQPLGPIVHVQGHPTRGHGFYLLDVSERRATLLESWIPALRRDGHLIPRDHLIGPNVSDTDSRQQDLADMSRSQRIAAAVALHEAGLAVKAAANGVRVTGVYLPETATQLQTDDVITQANGKPVLTPEDLRAAVASRPAGSPINVRFRRGKDERSARIRTTRFQGRNVLGVFVEQDVRIHLPLRVRIDLPNVGGPSGGLAFALQIYSQLNPGLLALGKQVAATGEIFLGGQVGPIGGVREKTIGARRHGIDLMLVPAGENATEARRYAGPMRIVPVSTFQQALRALTTANQRAAA